MQDFLNPLLSSLDAAKFIETYPFLSFIVSYAAGFLTAFTPCVWPVYPLSFLVISKMGLKDGSKLANLFRLIVFVTGISVVFAVIGLLSGIFGMGFQMLLRTGIPMIIAGLIFILLSLSMFGLYEIRLPYFITRRIQNSAPEKRNKGIVSIFLTGAFSGFITSPCVAPPLAGILILIATTGEVFMGFTMLLLFGFGLGTPLVIIGIAGTSKIIPSPGKWTKIIQYLIGATLFILGCFFIYDQIALYTQKDESAIEKTYEPVCDSVTGICHFDPETGAYTAKNIEKRPQWKNVESKKSLDRYFDAKRPFILRFTADWCTYCGIMDKESFSSSEFAARASDISWLVADATNPNEEVRRLLSRYLVSGLPTILMFDGERDTMFLGYLSPEKLFDRMDAFYYDMRKRDKQFILDKNILKVDTAIKEKSN